MSYEHSPARDRKDAAVNDPSYTVDEFCAAERSEARIQLIRRYAACCVLAEEMESRLVRGGQIDITEHAQLTSTMVRIAQRIGLDRVPRDISSPSLADILREGQP